MSDHRNITERQNLPERGHALSAAQHLRAGWGVYVHVPFCRSKCAYCDFYSHPADKTFRMAYGNAVIGQMEREAGHWRRRLPSGPATVFFGGGTPTLLPGAAGAQILETLRRCYGLDERRGSAETPAEITIEANPGTVDERELASWAEAGCNRISLGVQAFQPRLLAFLGRRQRLADVTEAVALARKIGIDNISLDLIYGIPGQTLEDWRLSLELALGLAPAHLSLYNLKAEAGTPLAEWMNRGLANPCDEDLEVEMYEAARQILKSAGLAQYELSNFARPGRECRHNLNYWRRGDYLGFGSGAVSAAGLQRWSWPADSSAFVHAFQKGETFLPIEEEGLSALVAAQEAIILGLRTMRGVSLTAVAGEYGLDDTTFEKWHRLSADLSRQGWIDYDGTTISLAPRSYLIANEIMARYLD
ncbi:radical SAM family heme chaperone HemW [Heliobacterium gestii]|uniref:Heme chaperone HemW n=1 Tax=Heliomicrobium gestii TaxID=2699 RepID=A0A845LBU4_HELGE|nr:radical SAM family heme chaperone HemW [Heliomicrobium gestii]MBM7868011.1 oxygen-independent coproporphyrinogen-3 oxidase [Heliomicrobium gestii]MZP44277.1 radical SAM family heme chaperone HemW [Heliomicrobium gestii]